MIYVDLHRSVRTAHHKVRELLMVIVSLMLFSCGGGNEPRSSDGNEIGIGAITPVPTPITNQPPLLPSPIPSPTSSPTPNPGPEETNNLAPIVVDDAFEKIRTSALVLSFSDVLANDSDPEGDTIIIIGVENSVGGSVDINGAFFFVSPESEASNTRFDYVLTDGRQSVRASVNILWQNKENVFSFKVKLTDIDVVELSWTLPSEDFDTIEVLEKREVEQEFRRVELISAQASSYRLVDKALSTRYLYKIIVKGSIEEIDSEVEEVLTDTLSDAQLYQVKCGGCHTLNGDGIPPFPPIKGPSTFAEIRDLIENSGFVRCKIEGGCAINTANYVLNNIINR